jgi:predicted DNA-binding antitoxin AbrB/MazE fold protein
VVKENECFFVEVKKEYGVLSPLQKVRIEEMIQKKINVKIWTSYGKDFNR